MSYRVNSADSFMINGRYKKINPKAYPTSDERNKFNKIAQEGDKAVLTAYPYPEHFSLEPEWHFTLCDNVYFNLWKIRVNVCEYYKKNKQDDMVGLVTPPDGAKVDRFFRRVPNMSDDDYKKLFFDTDENGKGWASAATKFIDIVLMLIDKPEECKLKDGKLPEKFQKDLESFVSQLGYSDEDMKNIADEIPNFFIQFGKAFPTVIHSTIYSRFYYFFLFLTINGNFDFSEIEKSEGMKLEEFNRQTMKVMATVFAQIFSKVYEENYNYENKDAGFMDKVLSYFSVSDNIDNVRYQSKNIETVKKVLTHNKTLLSSSN
uniref:Putative spore wall protein n=1 Tax=Nosema pernyi TaxID=1112939 RepID=A0A0N7AC01_9MICR|nr:putative spore wall protein [Nosema pernyi]